MPLQPSALPTTLFFKSLQRICKAHLRHYHIGHFGRETQYTWSSDFYLGVGREGVSTAASVWRPGQAVVWEIRTGNRRWTKRRGREGQVEVCGSSLSSCVFACL